MSLTDEQAEPDDAPAAGARWRADPLVAVVGLVSLGLYLLNGFQGFFSRDLGVYAYGARQVLAGEPPYVGIVNRAGPLAHLVPVPGIVAARILGGDELIGMRAWNAVLAVACVMVTYVVARDLFGSRGAGLVSAASMLGFGELIRMAVAGPQPKVPMMLFIVGALWALARRRWLLTGVLVSLATLTLQVAFFPLLAAVVVAILMGGRGRRLRDLVRFAVGGAIPVAVLLAYFAAYGALRDLADGILVLNLRYTSGTPLTSRSAAWASMHRGYGASLWLLLGGLVLILAMTVLRVADRSRRHEPATTTMVALAVATVGSMLWTEVDFDSAADSCTLLSLAALGLGAGFAELDRRLPRRAVLVVAGLAVVLPTALAVHFSAAPRGGQLPLQRAVASEVLSHVPNARVWSIEAPEYLVLADRTNPTRYQMFSAGLDDYVDRTWPGGTDAFVAWNLARDPDVIVVNPPRLQDQPWRARIGPGYVKVASVPGGAWFVRRSVGPDVIAAIRAGDARVHERLG